MRNFYRALQRYGAIICIILWSWALALAWSGAVTDNLAAAINGTATANSTAFASVTPTAGSALIVLSGCSTTGTGCVSSVSDGTNTWALAVDCSPSSSEDAQIFYALNVAGSAVTVTLNYSGTQIIDAKLLKVTGIATSSALDGTACNSGVGTTLNTGSKAPTSGLTTDFAIGMAHEVANNNAPASGPTNSYNALANLLDGGFNHAMYSAYLGLSSASATSTGWTNSASVTFGAPIALFKASAGATGISLSLLGDN